MNDLFNSAIRSRGYALGNIIKSVKGEKHVALLTRDGQTYVAKCAMGRERRRRLEREFLLLSAPPQSLIRGVAFSTPKPREFLAGTNWAILLTSNLDGFVPLAGRELGHLHFFSSFLAACHALQSDAGRCAELVTMGRLQETHATIFDAVECCRPGFAEWFCNCAARAREALERHPKSFCHYDLNGWNVLYEDRTATYAVIDWERACYGCSVFDVAQMLTSLVVAQHVAHGSHIDPLRNASIVSSVLAPHADLSMTNLRVAIAMKAIQQLHHYARIATQDPLARPAAKALGTLLCRAAATIRV